MQNRPSCNHNFNFNDLIVSIIIELHDGLCMDSQLINSGIGMIQFKGDYIFFIIIVSIVCCFFWGMKPARDITMLLCLLVLIFIN